jgi:hypothetical protein
MFAAISLPGGNNLSTNGQYLLMGVGNVNWQAAILLIGRGDGKSGRSP